MKYNNILCELIFSLIIFFIYAVNVSQINAQTKNENENHSQKQLESLWNFQVQSATKDFNLSQDKLKKLQELYVITRKNQREAIKELPEENDKQKSRLAIIEVNQKEKSNLQAQLKNVLTEEQIAQVIPLLGSFNPRYDSYTELIMSLELDEEKNSAAMKLIGEYIINYDKARQQADSSGERFSAKVSSELKSKLDNGLKNILTSEQYDRWLEATSKSKKEKTKD